MRFLSDKLVKLVKIHSNRIINLWQEDINSDPAISAFDEVNAQYFRKAAIEILDNLQRWLSFETTKEDIGRHYAKDGIRHFNAGLPLCEISRALMILKKSISIVAIDEAAIDSAFELNQLSDFNERILVFFDRAFYYVIRGYMEEMNRKMKSELNLSDVDTEKVLFEKSFYKRGFMK